LLKRHGEGFGDFVCTLNSLEKNMKLLYAAVALSAWSGSLAFAEGQVTFRVGYPPGGSYDAVSRLVADHLGRFLDGNPTVIVSNEPGAGSKKLAKLFQASGAADGSELAVISSALALNPIFSPEDQDYDPTKVHYIASMASEASYCVVSKASGITSMDQLINGDYKIGATGKDSTTYVFPAAIKAAFGAKYEVVTGFEGGPEIELAIERGELEARCGIGLTSLGMGDFLERFTVIGEISAEPMHEIDGVEFILDRATDPATRDALKLVFSSNIIHYPVIVPPDTPTDVVEKLRSAFIAMSTDPAFLADVEARDVYFHLTSGGDVEARIDSFLAMPDDVKALARSFAQ
jgi:ABC-type phosphate/phosphonate transport system substrate-binding protein